MAEFEKIRALAEYNQHSVRVPEDPVDTLARALLAALDEVDALNGYTEEGGSDRLAAIESELEDGDG